MRHRLLEPCLPTAHRRPTFCRPPAFGFPVERRRQRPNRTSLTALLVRLVSCAARRGSFVPSATRSGCRTALSSSPKQLRRPGRHSLRQQRESSQTPVAFSATPLLLHESTVCR